MINFKSREEYSLYGHWVSRDEFEAQYPSLVKEWDDWLDIQRDPGHYDEGETYLPPHLVLKAINLTPRV
jgi:hypothetical protein